MTSSAIDALREEIVDVGGIQTHYWETGRGDPVVLIHGGGAGADAYGNWAQCMPRFASQFRTIAYDIVGFGRSAPLKRGFVYSQDARIEHLRAFLDGLGLERPALVGNSMGGATALGLAMRHPGRASRLVLMGSAGLTHEFSPELRTIVDYREPDRDGMRRIADALTHASFTVDDELVDYRYELTRADEVMDAYRATMTWIREAGGLFYDEAEIATVKVPTLIVSGREDAVVPLALSVRFHQLLENSWLYAIPNCGHWAMIEHPDDFADVTIRFLSSGKERQE
jgi:2-hydroxy-6-oxo-6-(2'-aminophenyl)hexa-2,4-dienoate hydrolase